MSHSKRTDFQIEQQIFLGGQVSNKLPDFKDMARLSPDYAEIYMFLKKMDEIDKMTDEGMILAIIELFGEIDFVRNCSELTKLSMIMGDTRGRYNVKGAMDELRKTGSSPEP
jgi:hypothetical protein